MPPLRPPLPPAARIFNTSCGTGVRILPEFDQPGHAAGLCATLGNVGLVCCGTQIEDDAAGKSIEIMKSLMSEMATLFPDAVMSIGSDETGGCGNVTGYEVKMIEHLLSIGKQPMGWEEIQLKTGAATYFPSVIVELWGGGNWSDIAATNHRTVNADKELFYLDYVNHQSVSMWIDLYGTNPNQTGTPAQRPLLIGGETAMWGETAPHIPPHLPCAYCCTRLGSCGQGGGPLS